MLKIFQPTDQVFNSNGDIVIKPYSAKVHQEDNGDYYIDIVAGTEYSDWLIARNIVVAPTPDGDQPFRLTNPEKTGSKITIRGYHVFDDSKNYLIADSYVVDLNCNDALNHLNAATEPESIFTMGSDIPYIDSFRCVRKSLYEAIQTVLERWSGHLVIDGFNIRIDQNIGVDRGITVEYAKNLKEITSEENWDDVCTKILPEGTDGILLNALNPDESIYIDAEIQYDTPFVKTVQFNQDINSEDYPSETAYKQALIDDLRTQAIAYLEIHQVPEVNYSLKADINHKVTIGDTIEVKDRRLGIDLLTHVISLEYDCILGTYDEIEFGNFKQKLSNLISGISSSVDLKINEAVNNLNASMAEEYQGGFVRYNGNEITILDELPVDSAVNVIKLNNMGITASNDGYYGTYNTLLGINGVPCPLIGGESFDLAGNVVAGYTTSSNQKVHFTVPVEKSMHDVDISCSVCKLSGRLGTGGYLFSSSYVAGGYDVLDDSNLTLTVTKLSDHMIDVLIERASGTFEGDNDMANTIAIDSMVIDCA